jgi:hypothetical protein
LKEEGELKRKGEEGFNSGRMGKGTKIAGSQTGGILV